MQRIRTRAFAAAACLLEKNPAALHDRHPRYASTAWSFRPPCMMATVTDWFRPLRFEW